MSYEVKYMIPFEVLFVADFVDTWEIEDANFSDEILNLQRLLNIRINPISLAEEYCVLEHGQGDVHVFYDSVKENFVRLDLYFSHTDQHNMIELGVHVLLSMKNIIRKMMLEIYNLAEKLPRSEFIECENNELLADINPALYPKEIGEYEIYRQNIIFH